MAEALFDRIAGVYGLFHRYQMKRFSRILDTHGQLVMLDSMETICDVGCGTGALCSVLASRGFTVTGVDTAQRMIEVARMKSRSKSIQFLVADALQGLPFPDNAFDLVFTSYVAHGMQLPNRITLYRELMRIAKRAVIVHDYNENRAVLTTLIEWLERGDYFGFIKHARSEMEAVFPTMTTVQVDTRAFWYICTCESQYHDTGKTEDKGSTIE